MLTKLSNWVQLLYKLVIELHTLHCPHLLSSEGDALGRCTLFLLNVTSYLLRTFPPATTPSAEIILGKSKIPATEDATSAVISTDKTGVLLYNGLARWCCCYAPTIRNTGKLACTGSLCLESETRAVSWKMKIWASMTVRVVSQFTLMFIQLIPSRWKRHHPRSRSWLTCCPLRAYLHLHCCWWG